MEKNFNEEQTPTENIETQNINEDSEIDGVDILFLDDDDDGPHDEVIEIDEEDLTFDETPKEQEEIVLSKHTMEGKHSLKYDSIFKGKKEDPLSEESIEFSVSSYDGISVDPGSLYWTESMDNENYIKEKRIREKVYQILLDHTDLNFMNNRRKPSRSDFNHYYYLLKTNLHQESFTNIEIFNELAVYFSDNLFNMFKLLDNKWRNLIISELQDHIGKQNYSKEIRNRNIFIGTEVEFLGDDPSGLSIDQIHITGVVVETDYESSIFMVNSYEKIYEVQLVEITKILNNSKFRYNLNKLNNIDFL